eukprot:Seg1360.2 transcript_id=Seg1360.2/GoldUCD/mRNA.D3Y31 product="hypothetical protein" protein_id=Seg1360.2/GoldUCD/D3Y31
MFTGWLRGTTEKSRPPSSKLLATESDSSRHRRSIEKASSKVFFFDVREPDKGELHRVESFSMGEIFMILKENSPDESYRVALQKSMSPIDCAAFDLSTTEIVYVNKKESQKEGRWDKA